MEVTNLIKMMVKMAKRERKNNNSGHINKIIALKIFKVKNN